MSRALNNKPDVNPETRARVLNAAVELGYSANASGRSLRRGATQTIGFVMETGQSDLRAGDNFFLRVIDAMQAELDAGGYDLVILPCHSAHDPTEFLKRVIARGMVDAVVLSATRRHDPRIELLARSKMPFLTLGRSQTPGVYAWIDLDFEGFVARSLALLAGLGHRRVAMSVPVGDSNIGAVLRAGFAEGVAQLGLDADPSLVIAAEHSETGGHDLMRGLLARAPRPTAVLLNYEVMAFGAYAALAEAGLRPGSDMSVITLRRSRQLRFLDPPLTAFDMDLEALGRGLARAALATLSGEVPPDGVIWPSELRPTASVAPPPG